MEIMKNNMEESQIAKWYAGQSILITGATGFMGKVLLEKILRTCSQVECVFILIRPKRSMEINRRLEEFLKSPAFDILRKQPNSRTLFSKIKCINGDVTKKNCDVGVEELQLLQSSVTMVFNMAANVRFDQSLKTAVLDNVGGTQNVLQLATNFQQLKIFMYVATSFSHCYEDVLEEKTYKSPQDPKLSVMRLIYGIATRVGFGEPISEALGGAFVPPGVEYSDDEDDYDY